MIRLTDTRGKAHYLSPEHVTDIFEGPKGEGTAVLRRSNIRIVTYSENRHNMSGCQSNCKSGMRGVYWSEYRNRWIARLFVDGKLKQVGSFKNKYDANRAIS